MLLATDVGMLEAEVDILRVRLVNLQLVLFNLGQ